jgi:putative endonuclease
MTSQSNALGRAGEDLAASYLETSGYALLARNWRLLPRGGELDIVAKDNEWLVFVEVRTRRAGVGATDPVAGTPEESVTPAKQGRLAKLAEAFLYEHPWSGPARIDVIALELNPDGSLARLNHLVDAVGGVG